MKTLRKNILVADCHEETLIALRPCFLGPRSVIPGHLGSGHNAVRSAACSRNNLRLVAGNVYVDSQRSLGEGSDSFNLGHIRCPSRG